MRKGKEVSASEMELLLRTCDRSPALFERIRILVQMNHFLRPQKRSASTTELMYR